MNYSGHRKLLCELSKLSKLNAFILLGCIYSGLQIPPREYVRRVYAIAINCPCIITLSTTKCRFRASVRTVFSIKCSNHFTIAINVGCSLHFRGMFYWSFREPEMPLPPRLGESQSILYKWVILENFKTIKKLLNRRLVKTLND